MKENSPLAVIILAAGLGKRMKSDLPKVIHSVGNRTVIQRILTATSVLKPKLQVVVIGYKGALTEESARAGSSFGFYPLESLRFATQTEQRGTGHATQVAIPQLEQFTGTVLILPGDAPLISDQTLNNLLSKHRATKATVSLLTFKLSDPRGYGRIVRTEDDLAVARIIEEKDTTPESAKINELNSSIYAVEIDFLREALPKIQTSNAQGEYYLTDIIEIAAKAKKTITPVLLSDNREVLGINTKRDLHMVREAAYQRKVEALIESGVDFIDPRSAYIEEEVTIATGAKIGPNVQILGRSTIASGAVIEGTAWIKDCSIGEGTHIKLGVRMEDSTIGRGAVVGPFANLRPGTKLGDEVKIGNFVETKKATFDAGAKASHLSYIGDATVGKDANIGAGTITCNYDGYNKFQTTIGAGAFIGSNTALVAPVEIGAGATVGAGSTITKKVSADALAFTRAPQQEKAGWSKSKREKSKK